MIDAGWGALMRFREAGAQFDQLALLAISHLHPDHVSDLPALFWGERGRGAPLPISGPSGTPQFPDLGTFLTRMFSPTSGAFQVLEGTLRSGGSGPSLEATIVDISRPEPAPILVQGSLRVTALGVPHGNTPSLAYRVQVGDRTIVFGSDQNGGNEKFIEFARDADALVMHFPLSSRAPEARRRVHAPPVVVGRLAKEAAVQHLILSHFSKAPSDSAPEGESLSDLAASVAEVRTQYRGRVSTSRDLECFPVP
jgi:ribonuclease BN (tRNA processing enzyme)